MASGIDVAGSERIRFNGLAARLDVITHQHGENVIGFNRVVNLNAQQAAHGRVHGGFPQLRWVHLAQSFVTLT